MIFMIANFLFAVFYGPKFSVIMHKCHSLLQWFLYSSDSITGAGCLKHQAISVFCVEEERIGVQNTSLFFIPVPLLPLSEEVGFVEPANTKKPVCVGQSWVRINVLGVNGESCNFIVLFAALMHCHYHECHMMVEL